jgi:hypothetical protein
MLSFQTAQSNSFITTEVNKCVPYSCVFLLLFIIKKEIIEKNDEEKVVIQNEKKKSPFKISFVMKRYKNI